ncbi:hypothetical protein KUTeg_008010 [Tegillarca granosa]|uniref:Uncharacterized protein n=1 Tax=Tegillarca granosa TaxID=220873 RepID=A0ABQ9FEY2_TEGGR|nr:hypothetical protein KUTeg_008010 [Tegillarca granosa]
MEPAPIGFEMQNVDGRGQPSAHVTQINIGFVDQPAPGVGPAQQEPALYPPINDNYPPPPDSTASPGPVQPIGFEAQEVPVNDGKKEATVDVERHPEVYISDKHYNSS